MSNTELDQLLATIDSAGDVPQDVERRVWNRVRHDFDDHGTKQPPQSATDELGAVIVITTDISPTQGTATQGSRSLTSSLALAAAVVVIVGLVLAAVVRQDSRDQTDLATGATVDQTLPTVVEAPIDRAAACEHFLSTAGPLIGVEESFGDPNGNTPAALRVTIEALERLALDFRSQVEPDQDELDAIEQIVGGLRQAELHLRNNERSAAIEAFDFSESVYNESTLSTDVCLGH